MSLRHRFLEQTKRMPAFVAVVMLLSLAGCAKETVIQAVPSDYPYKPNYLPAELQHVSLGMKHQDFARIFQHVPPAELPPKTIHYEVKESVSDGHFTGATYHIDLDGLKPLYEIILHFPENYDVNQYARDRYGEPNYKLQWRFNSGKDFFIIVQIRERSLVFGATLPETVYAKFMKSSPEKEKIKTAHI